MLRGQMGDDEAIQILTAIKIPITHRAIRLKGGGGTVRIQKLWLSNRTINKGGHCPKGEFQLKLHHICRKS